MEPQEIDKLFGERLKHTAPTPPPDLWNRLQERIETEMPAPQQEPKHFMLLPKAYYSIAAAITVLLAAGMVFFQLRHELPAGQQELAQLEAPAPAASAPALPAPAPAGPAPADRPAGKAGATESPENISAPVTRPSAPAPTLAKADTKADAKASGSRQAQQTRPAPVKQPAVQALATLTPSVDVASRVTEPGAVMPPPVDAEPVMLAAAHPVEIIIKRAPATEAAGSNAEEAAEELSGFEKKQRLAKGIFRQARNLTTGEPVDLSDIGINANRIAFETQIGKQKISKVINL